MIRYQAYKDSGVEWIGEIPFQWAIKRLKYVSDCNTSNVDKHSKEDENKVNLCNYTDVYKNDKIHSRMDFMSATASQSEIEKFQLKKDDVLITKDSETPDDIAIPAIVTEDLYNILCGYHLALIRSSDKYLIGTYLYYLFKSYRFNQQFTIAANGITRFGLSIDDVRDAIISLPSTAEQSQIAVFLDHKTHQIDDLIAKKQKIIELLKEERTAIINHTVTKGLDPTVPMKDSGIEWLGKVPEHWELRKIGRSFKIIGSGTTPTSGREEFYQNGNIPWVLTGDLNDNYLSQTSKSVTEKAFEEHSALKKFPAGSLVIAMYGATIGRLSILEIEATTNQACCVLGDSAFYSIRFLFYWFLSNRDNIISLSYGGGQPNISQEIVRNIKTPCPSIVEQSDIVEFLDFKCNAIDTSLFHIEKEIELISEYKTTLINEAVTGKIDVHNYVIKNNHEGSI